MIGLNKRIIRIVVAFLLFLILFNIFLMGKKEYSTSSKATSSHLLDVINYNSETKPDAQEVLEPSNYNGLKMTLEELKTSIDETKVSTEENLSKATNNPDLITPHSSNKTAMESSSTLVTETSASASVDLSISSSEISGSSSQEVGAKGVIYNNKQDTAETTPYEAAKEFDNLVKIYPMILFSKTYCPFSKGMKDLLSKFDIIPALKIVELDTHENGVALQKYVVEKTGRKTVPNIIIPEQSLQSLGGFDDLKDLSLDDLAKTINAACGDTCSIEQKKNLSL